VSAFISKYGVAVHVYIPMIKRGVVDFAVSADWTPAAGDVKISKDGGAAANVTNLPTAITMGNTAMWDYSITATEMQAAKVMVTIADSATKAVEDSMFTIWTHGNASGQYQVDFADSTAFGLSRLDAAITSRLAPTVAARTLDVSAGGEAGVDWANVGSPTTAVDLSGTTIKTTQKVDVDTIKTNPVVNGGTITFPTNATVASTTGAVGSVTGAVGSVTGAVGSVTGAVGSVTGNVGGNVVGSVGSLTTNNDKTGYTLSNTGIDNILDRTAGVETSFTLRQALRLILSSAAAKLSGAATTTVKLRDINDTKDRITATVDSDGNRTAITTDVT
jgi:hypothetical protein